MPVLLQLLLPSTTLKVLVSQHISRACGSVCVLSPPPDYNVLPTPKVSQDRSIAQKLRRMNELHTKCNGNPNH